MAFRAGSTHYATRIANELPAKMRERGIRADPIEAKPFDPMDEKNEELVRPFVRAFLLPLAGEHVDVQSVLDRLLEYQQSRDDRWMQSLPLLSKGEISRICDNLDRNGGFLSAISQTHGNPSALHDFAAGFVGLLLVEATKHEMTKSIEPKPFDLNDPENKPMIRSLCALDAGPALATALELPTPGRTPDASKLFALMRNHFATCSSDDFWSLSGVTSQYELFGLSINIAFLQILAARVAGGGKLTDADIHMLARLLKDFKRQGEYRVCR